MLQSRPAAEPKPGLPAAAEGATDQLLPDDGEG